jgi:CHAD domain-containing protein
MTVGSDPNEGGEVGSQPANGAALVHETRKTIKRMRALARLLRYQLGEPEFERVEGSLRAAGRRLGGARDAEVRIATLGRLRTRHPNALESQGIERLEDRLEREREQTGESPPPEDVLADIADMRRHLARWNLVEHDFDSLAPGLTRIYREGRRRRLRVKRGRARNGEDVHDWRKRVKSLYYALDMLGGTSARGARRATQQAERIGDLLGEEHDLSMLCAYVEQYPHTFGQDTSSREMLLKLAERRRKRLRKRALKLGAQLYKRKPNAFSRRIGNALSR